MWVAPISAVIISQSQLAILYKKGGYVKPFNRMVIAEFWTTVAE
jgi:hypothetical protein